MDNSNRLKQYLSTSTPNKLEDIAKSIRKQKKENTLFLTRSIPKFSYYSEQIIASFIPEFTTISSLQEKVKCIIKSFSILSSEALYNCIDYLRINVIQHTSLISQVMPLVITQIKKGASSNIRYISTLTLLNFIVEYQQYNEAICTDDSLLNEIINFLNAQDYQLIENCLLILSNVCMYSLEQKLALLPKITIEKVETLTKNNIDSSVVYFVLCLISKVEHPHTKYCSQYYKLLYRFTKSEDYQIKSDAFIGICELIYNYVVGETEYKQLLKDALELQSDKSKNENNTMIYIKVASKLTKIARWIACFKSEQNQAIIAKIEAIKETKNEEIKYMWCKVIGKLVNASNTYANYIVTNGIFNELIKLIESSSEIIVESSLTSILKISRYMDVKSLQQYANKIIHFSIKYATSHQTNIGYLKEFVRTILFMLTSEADDESFFLEIVDNEYGDKIFTLLQSHSNKIISELSSQILTQYLEEKLNRPDL